LILRPEWNNSATLSSQKRGMQLPARQLLSAMPKLPRKFMVTFEFKNRRGTMVLSHNFERVYGPDTLKIITAAFDNAHECLPAEFKKSEHARRKLALLILRHMERGEHDPSRLAETAVLDFLR
jgi:hypothetical protein